MCTLPYLHTFPEEVTVCYETRWRVSFVTENTLSSCSPVFCDSPCCCLYPVLLRVSCIAPYTVCYSGRFPVVDEWSVTSSLGAPRGEAVCEWRSAVRALTEAATRQCETCSLGL
ncbi:hypothetical protein FKM82_028279 [Ascaphus truei]